MHCTHLSRSCGHTFPLTHLINSMYNIRKCIIKTMVCFLLFFKPKNSSMYAKLQLQRSAIENFFQKKHLLVVGRMRIRIREAQKLMVPTRIRILRMHMFLGLNINIYFVRIQIWIFPSTSKKINKKTLISTI
jgi:hypothetical protein